MKYSLEKISTLSPTKQQLLEILLKQKGLNLDIAPIPHRPDSKQACLSFPQQGLWSSALTPSHPIYNISTGLYLTGKLNISALEQSLNSIINRQESLRTSFSEDQSSPKQIIHSQVNFKLSFINLTQLENPNTHIQSFINQESRRSFDLTIPPLFRATLLQIGEQNHLLLLIFHHLIFDQWSWGIFLQELAAFYQTYSDSNHQEKSPALSPLTAQYPDLAQWHRHSLKGELLERYLDYWKQQLKDTTPLSLPPDQQPTTPTYSVATKSLLIPYALTRTLQTLSQTEGVTLFMTLLAAFKLLLHRYTGINDISISSPFSNRKTPDNQALIGCFVNDLILRNNLSDDSSFRDLLIQVRQTVAGAASHQDLPLETITKALNLSSKWQPHLSFSLQKSPQTQPLTFPGLTISFLEIESPFTCFDLSLVILEESENLTATVTYRTDVFQENTIAQLLNDFQTLLNRITQNPEQPLSSLAEPITPKETTANKPEIASAKKESTPADKIQLQLKQIWEEALNIRPINLDDNFFEIGGHSLLAVRVFSTIREKFKKDLPLATLFQAPTIAALAEVLRSEEKASWSSLVPIQTPKSKPPLFCIHAVGGNVLSYKPLAYYLGENQPVYGLQARGLDGTQPPHENLEEMAADYIQQIQNVQPQGPYYFAGHSLGGVIAFEIAQQLVKAGEKVAFLGFFDSYSPLMLGKGVPPFSYQMSIHKMNLSRKNTPQKIKYISERVWWKVLAFYEKVSTKFLGGEKGSLANQLPEHFIRIEKANSKAVKTYKPQPYPGKITLFRSWERPTRDYYDPLLGWGDLALGGIEVQEVFGHHKTLILEPQVRLLSQRLKACLEKAQSEHESP